MYLLLFLTLFSGVSSQLYSYAVDLYNNASYNDFVVLTKSGYGVVFIRVYEPYGSNGAQMDPNACGNINDADNANQVVELYMTPNAKSTQTAAQQAQEVINGLLACNIGINGLWIQVVQPSYWPTSTANNVQFIKQMIQTFESNNAYFVNIYTTSYDWNAITGNFNSNSLTTRRQPHLWYANVLKTGTKGETPPDFNDFIPFAGWTSPFVKQYGQQVKLSGVNVKPLNRDVYSTLIDAKQAKKFNEKGKVIVGGNI